MGKASVNLRKKRFNSINKRLDAIDEDQIWKFLLGDGYYPDAQFLPNDFFTTRSLVKETALSKLKKHKAKLNPNSSPSWIRFPKGKFSFRVFGIPDLINYLHLVTFISNEWKNFHSHFKLTSKDLIIPYTYPLFYTNKRHAEIGISNHRVFSEIDIPSSANYYSHCLQLDIKNFYSSVYTHSLSWALDERTVHGWDCECMYKKKKFVRCEYHKSIYWPNKFDELTRKLNRNRTKGILTGPQSSVIASEVILRTVDLRLSEYCNSQKIDISGHRFRDDYFIFAKNSKDVDRVRVKIQKLLEEFHLDVNESKTKILLSEEMNDNKSWKVDTEHLKAEIGTYIENNLSHGCVTYKEKTIRLWLKKTYSLYEKYNDVFILFSVLSELIPKKVEEIKLSKKTTKSYPHSLGLDDVYTSVFSYIALLAKKEPQIWPLVTVFMCMCFEGQDKKLVEKTIEEFFSDYANKFTDEDDNFNLIWTLYGMWRCGIKADNLLKKKIRKNFSDNWMIQALIGARVGTIVIDGIEYRIINRNKSTLKPINTVVLLYPYTAINSYAKASGK